MKFEIKKWGTGSIICTAEIDASEGNSTSFKMGLAIKWAVGQKIDLQGADLRGADLQGADLQGADLRCADLRGADLRCADLRCADLQGADLRGADNEKILLFSDRPIMQIGPMGSRKDYLVSYFTEKGVLIQAGCFTGTLAEFEMRAKEIHGASDFGKEYAAAVVFIKAQAKIWMAKEKNKKEAA